MSFYTHVERFYLESDEFDVAALSDPIDALVSERWSEDVANDLKQLLADGKALFRMVSWAVIEMMDEIAALAPKVSFAVRGFGEDPRMIWVREYEHGSETFAFGPPPGAEA